MKSTKLITTILALGMISTGALAHQHTHKGFYVGFEGGMASLDGHCDALTKNVVRKNGNTGDLDLTKLELSSGTTQSITLNVTPVTLTVNHNVAVSVTYPTCDDSSTSFKGIAGYQFNENLAVEGFYSAVSGVDLVGKAAFKVTVAQQNSIFNKTVEAGVYDANVGFNDEVGVSSFGLNAKGQYEVSNNILINGRLGLHFWDVSHKYSSAASSISLTNTDDTTTNATITDFEKDLPTSVTQPVQDETGVGVLFGAGAAYQFNRNFDVNGGFDIMTGDVQSTSFYAGMTYRF